jgi:outer membrane immunogenic protein
MRRFTLAVAVILILNFFAAITSFAQAAARAGSQLAPLEVTFAYNADRTNGVVGGCGCFWLSGGKVEASAAFPNNLSVVAELSGEQASNINANLKSLGFVTYLFGPRYTFPSRARLVPFAQFLLGGVHGFDALFPSTGPSDPNPDAFAFAAGGGLNANFSSRVAVRLVQADYMQTQLPNDANSRENHLRLSAGIVFRFGSGLSNP